jgi:hypothetical protein
MMWLCRGCGSNKENDAAPALAPALQQLDASLISISYLIIYT